MRLGERTRTMRPGCTHTRLLTARTFFLPLHCASPTQEDAELAGAGFKPLQCRKLIRELTAAGLAVSVIPPPPAAKQ